MNPEPQTKHDDRPRASVGGDGAMKMMERLLGLGAPRASRGAREYPDAVPGSADPRRRRRALGEGGPGIVTRWRAEDGSLHRRRREAGPGAVLVRLQTPTLDELLTPEARDRLDAAEREAELAVLR
jgi:hypothetical protein